MWARFGGCSIFLWGKLSWPRFYGDLIRGAKFFFLGGEGALGSGVVILGWGWGWVWPWGFARVLGDPLGVIWIGLIRSATRDATWIYHFITSNHVSFHLWWKENLFNIWTWLQQQNSDSNKITHLVTFRSRSRYIHFRSWKKNQFGTVKSYVK